MVTEQAAIPGDHIEQQERAMHLYALALVEALCLRMHAAGLTVSLHVGLTLVCQPLAVLRQRHQCRSILVQMLPNKGVQGRRGRGKRRQQRRAKAFDVKLTRTQWNAILQAAMGAPLP